MEQSTSATNLIYATKAKRIIAYLLDAVLVAIIGWFFLNAFFASVLSAVYMLTRDAIPFLDGQSVGKKMLNIQAVNSDNLASLSGDWEKSIKRNILLAIPVVGPLAELIVFLASEDGRRLGDQWFNTAVVMVGEVTPQAESPMITETDFQE